MKKRTFRPAADEGVMVELPNVFLGSDGSISVSGRTLKEAKRAALELHRRQRARIRMDYDYF